MYACSLLLGKFGLMNSGFISCHFYALSQTLESLSNAKPPAKARESTAVEPSVSASTT